MKYAVTIAIILVAPLATLHGMENPAVESSNYWEITGPADKITWVEIHGFEDVNGMRIAHVEVMCRKKYSKPWEFTVLLPHLAISMEALKKSILHPLKTLSVYPETYETGYAQWRTEAAHGTTAICTTAIADALAAPK